MRIDFSKLGGYVAEILKAAPVWIDAAAKVVNWASALIRTINEARQERDISEAEWIEAKQKNNLTLADLVKLRGGTPPEKKNEE